MKYGIQLYSLRDVTPTDMEGALRQVADMGYKMVEFAGFFDYPAKKIAEWLKKYGLEACSTHTKLAAISNECIAYHKAIGCRHLIIPGISCSTKENLDKSIEAINYWQPILAREGISLHFHSHTGDFLPNQSGLVVMDELVSRTEILFEIDTHLAFMAGKDPIALLDLYADRVQFVHLKDGKRDGTDTALGEGDSPVAACHQRAKETGKIIVVESEGLDPTGPAEVARCMAFLKSLA